VFELMLRLLLMPMGILHDYPFVAVIPAIVFAFLALAFARGTRAFPILIVAALGWAAYLPYELHMQEWELTVSGPIRFDLVLIAPVLYLLALMAIVATVRAFRAGR
jgi:hypothetical protein